MQKDINKLCEENHIEIEIGLNRKLIALKQYCKAKDLKRSISRCT
jgi:hypothetical protein